MGLMQRLFTRSLVLRLGASLAIVGVLATISVISLVIFTENSTGKGSAINIAGSLRMQSYAIGLALSDTSVSDDARRAAVMTGVAELDARIGSTGLLNAIPQTIDDPTRMQYARLAQHWSALKPRVVAAAQTPAPNLIGDIRAMVGEADQLVRLIEADLDTQIERLKIFQGAALFLSVTLLSVIMYYAQEHIVTPLREFERVSRAIRQADFSARVSGQDTAEFDELAHAVNSMAADLSTMYGQLEARVHEKTEELERTNRSLRLLYDITRTLSEQTVTRDTLQRVLEQAEQVIGVRVGVICARAPGQALGTPLAITGSAQEIAATLCAPENCERCGQAPGISLHPLAGDAGQVMTMPLTESGRAYGVMPLRLERGMQLAPWQTELMESVGHHIGAALATAARTQEQHRLALFEERSVLARELHDSLAQALAYLKIQVVRLQKNLEHGGDPKLTEAILSELREGLNSAYRQLRELLTTFRLRIDGRGFATALRETIDEFARRTEVAVEFDNRISELELSANEQIHLLQVVREALSNIEHHARAAHAIVVLTRGADGAIEVTIDDDGVGINTAQAPVHHFGLAIMRDRAASLNGACTIARRDAGGTRVRLSFMPASISRSGSITEETA